MAPDEFRGRVFASDFMFFYLGSALASSLVGAAFGNYLTIPSIFQILAAIYVVATVLWSLWVMKGRRETVWVGLMLKRVGHVCYTKASICGSLSRFR